MNEIKVCPLCGSKTTDPMPALAMTSVTTAYCFRCHAMGRLALPNRNLWCFSKTKEMLETLVREVQNYER